MVIQSCLSKSEEGSRSREKYSVDSNLSTRYYLEDKWRLVPIEAIAGPAFCYAVGTTTDDIVHVHDKSDWKNSFLNFDE